MLYVFGVREVAITIVSDPDEQGFLAHAIERTYLICEMKLVERLHDTLTGHSWTTRTVLWKDEPEVLLQEIDWIEEFL